MSKKIESVGRTKKGSKVEGLKIKFPDRSGKSKISNRVTAVEAERTAIFNCFKEGLFPREVQRVLKRIGTDLVDIRTVSSKLPEGGRKSFSYTEITSLYAEYKASLAKDVEDISEPDVDKPGSGKGKGK